MLREPLLFDAISVHNPITDLTNYLLQQYELSPTRKTQLMEEFGDVENESIYNILKLMSPYHIPFVPRMKYQTDLLMTYDETDPAYEVHSQKFISKMREVNYKGDFMFIKKLNELEANPLLQKTTNYSFLALSLLFRSQGKKSLFEKSKDIERILEKQRLEQQLSQYENM